MVRLTLRVAPDGNRESVAHCCVNPVPVRLGEFAPQVSPRSGVTEVSVALPTVMTS